MRKVWDQYKNNHGVDCDVTATGDSGISAKQIDFKKESNGICQGGTKSGLAAFSCFNL